MDWRPITRSRVSDDAVERHPRAKGLLEVRIQLSEEPHPDWAQAFERGFGATINLSMHRFRLNGDEIVITPPDDELEAYVAEVDNRIAAANAWFEKEVLPRLTERERSEQARDDEETEKLANARRRARDL